MFCVYVCVKYDWLALTTMSRYSNRNVQAKIKDEVYYNIIGSLHVEFVWIMWIVYWRVRLE